ncbi:MAG TPA: hypothetical protein VF142_20155 [Longimicrobium sp.]
MTSPFRSVLSALLIALAVGAAAVAPAHITQDRPGDFVGSWITWAGTAEGGALPLCRRLQVTAGGAHTRDGAWDAPGWKGLVSGAVTAKDGSPVWRGEWRDGQIAGTFALTLRGRDAFEGTFAGAGLEGTQRWHGVRTRGEAAPALPCRFE